MNEFTQNRALALIFVLLALVMGAHLTYNVWRNQEINCPAECGNKVRRMNELKHYRPCENCQVPIWVCIENHKEKCNICKDIYWDCPPIKDENDNVVKDLSERDKHGEGICSPRPHRPPVGALNSPRREMEKAAE